MRWWVDDSDFQSDNELGTPDVFVFGGIAVPEGQEADLVKQVEDVKAAYGRCRAPVKWNFKDAMPFYGVGDEDKAVYENMLKSSSEWRRKIFYILGKSQITLIVTAIEAYSPNKEKVLSTRKSCARMAFANGLMRYAMHVKENPEDKAEVVIDWPAGNDRSPFTREYRTAYTSGKSADGQIYHSGTLAGLRFGDSLMFSNTNDSCMLQIADLVVGASRDFLRACLLGRGYGNGFKMLQLVKHRFRGAPQHVGARGLNVSSGNAAFNRATKLAIWHDLFENPRPKVAQEDPPF